MSVLVLLEVKVKPEEISNMKSYMAKIIPDTRTYDGCQGIDLYFDTGDTASMVAVEYWDSISHYEKYHAWRKETGVLDKIGTMLSGTPNIRYFEKIDA